MANLATYVTIRCSGGDTLRELRIVGHGNANGQWFGSDWICSSYLRYHTANLRKIGRCFDEIIKTVKTPRSVNVLRIYAHGNSGVIAVTGGDVLNYEASAISIWALPKLEPQLARLTPYFANGAQVELYGCYVATGEKGDTHVIKKNSDGEKLIIALAKLGT